MRYKKTIIFLGPVPWSFHNRQIPLFAEKLSKDFNVFYFDCSSLGVYTISFLELLNPKNFFKYRRFLKSIFNKKTSLIPNQIIITVFKYSEKQNLFWFDKVLFKLQVEKIARMTSYDNYIVWTSTVQFDEFWKTLSGATWVFDYFDRFPQVSDRIKTTERWLIKNSFLIFVNSSLYKKIATKILRSGIKDRVVVTPVGYNLKPYLKVLPNPKKTLITVGYGGGLSDRLDFPLIISVVKSSPKVKFVFAGPIYEESLHTIYKPYSTHEFITRLKKFSNVKIVPVVQGVTGIKRVMSQFTVGWIPYNTKVLFNKYSTPTKFYEYCAFGIPVVSTHLEILNEYPGLVYFVDKPARFGQMIKNILRKESRSIIKRRKDFADSNDIDRKYSIVRNYLKKIE